MTEEIVVAVAAADGVVAAAAVQRVVAVIAGDRVAVFAADDRVVAGIAAELQSHVAERCSGRTDRIVAVATEHHDRDAGDVQQAVDRDRVVTVTAIDDDLIERRPDRHRFAPFADNQQIVGGFAEDESVRRTVAVDSQSVVAGRVADQIVAAGGSFPNDRVVAQAAIEHIVAPLAVERVITGVAEERVVARTTENAIVAITSIDGVIAAVGADEIVASTTDQRVVSVSTEQGICGAIHVIVDNDADGQAITQVGSCGIRQTQKERFVRFRHQVIRDLDRDGLHDLPRRKCQRARGVDVVRALQRRARLSCELDGDGRCRRSRK